MIGINLDSVVSKAGDTVEGLAKLIGDFLSRRS
jgi:hypothetical protein